MLGTRCYIIQRSIFSISSAVLITFGLNTLHYLLPYHYCTYIPVCRVWQVHARAFFKKAFCAHQNRSIARGSVGPTKSFAPKCKLNYSHDIFCQIYPNLSVLPLSTSLAYGEVINEWIGWQFVCNLVCSLSFDWTEWYSMNILGWNLKFRSSKTAGNAPNT